MRDLLRDFAGLLAPERVRSLLHHYTVGYCRGMHRHYAEILDDTQLRRQQALDVVANLEGRRHKMNPAKYATALREAKDFIRVVEGEIGVATRIERFYDFQSELGPLRVASVCSADGSLPDQTFATRSDADYRTLIEPVPQPEYPRATPAVQTAASPVSVHDSSPPSARRGATPGPSRMPTSGALSNPIELSGGTSSRSRKGKERAHGTPAASPTSPTPAASSSRLPTASAAAPAVAAPQSPRATTDPTHSPKLPLVCSVRLSPCLPLIFREQFLPSLDTSSGGSSPVDAPPIRRIAIPPPPNPWPQDVPRIPCDRPYVPRRGDENYVDREEVFGPIHPNFVFPDSPCDRCSTGALAKYCVIPTAEDSICTRCQKAKQQCVFHMINMSGVVKVGKKHGAMFNGIGFSFARDLSRADRIAVEDRLREIEQLGGVPPWTLRRPLAAGYDLKHFEPPYPSPTHFLTPDPNAPPPAPPPAPPTSGRARKVVLSASGSRARPPPSASSSSVPRPRPVVSSSSAPQPVASSSSAPYPGSVAPPPDPRYQRSPSIAPPPHPIASSSRSDPRLRSPPVASSSFVPYLGPLPPPSDPRRHRPPSVAPPPPLLDPRIHSPPIASSSSAPYPQAPHTPHRFGPPTELPPAPRTPGVASTSAAAVTPSSRRKASMSPPTSHQLPRKKSRNEDEWRPAVPPTIPSTDPSPNLTDFGSFPSAVPSIRTASSSSASSSNLDPLLIPQISSLRARRQASYDNLIAAANEVLISEDEETRLTGLPPNVPIQLPTGQMIPGAPGLPERARADPFGSQRIRRLLHLPPRSPPQQNPPAGPSGGSSSNPPKRR